MRCLEVRRLWGAEETFNIFEDAANKSLVAKINFNLENKIFSWFLNPVISQRRSGPGTCKTTSCVRYQLPSSRNENEHVTRVELFNLTLDNFFFNFVSSLRYEYGLGIYIVDLQTAFVLRLSLNLSKIVLFSRRTITRFHIARLYSSFYRKTIRMFKTLIQSLKRQFKCEWISVGPILDE